MAKQGSERIGPVSILVLIIILCLAVMAVLTLITSEAEESITVRQEESTTAFYANEAEAQEYLARWMDCLLVRTVRMLMCYLLSKCQMRRTDTPMKMAC